MSQRRTTQQKPNTAALNSPATNSPAPAAASVAAASSSAVSKRKSRSEVAAAPDSSSSAAAPSLPASDEETQAAASASSSAVSNPHHASVLESASTSAPVAKRTRRAEQSAQVAAERILASSMLRLLSRDSGARQSLMTMLSVKDLASLVQSDRSWSAWITEEPASLGAQQVKLNSSSLSCFSQSRWAQRSVQTLCFSGVHAQPTQLNRLLQCLPHLIRLRTLVLRECDGVPLQPLRDSFSCVAVTLTDLDMSLAHAAESPAVVALWSAVKPLAGLTSLSVSLGACDAELDFSFLPSMTRLRRLRVDQHRDRVCSPEQVEALSQCRSLTDLHCGHWMTPLFMISDAARLQERQQRLANGISTFLRRRAVSGAAPLRRLYLGALPFIDPIGWQSLSQCTELEEINAYWSHALTEVDWSRLASFHQLQTLKIESLFAVERGHAPPSNLSHALPPLLHCRCLHSLTLCGELELRAEHAALIARIPSLEVLNCARLRIESLAPLTGAPALTELLFSSCTGLQGQAINIREFIPPMAHVNQLSIVESIFFRLSAAQAELCNAALLQRLPSLTLQSLRIN